LHKRKGAKAPLTLTDTKEAFKMKRYMYNGGLVAKKRIKDSRKARRF